MIFSHTASGTTASDRSVYQFSFKTLVGEKELSLKQYEGKVILIVNTASNCGFTKQYSGLEKLYQQYKEKGLVVLGVPSNDFGAQEPGQNDEIASFCKVNYGVTFPMTAKEVVSGKNSHPFYLFAKEQLGYLSAPKWNFHKYLINRQGHLIDYYYSTTSPDSARMKKAIEKALQE